ncbi:MAG: hypothetical protein AB7P24_09795 [Nitrospira sp.]
MIVSFMCVAGRTIPATVVPDVEGLVPQSAIPSSVMQTRCLTAWSA